MSRVTDYYIYVLFRENGVPFYVGKGKGPRIRHHEWRAKNGARGHRFNIIRKILAGGGEVPCLKLHEGLTETVAHEYEIALIKAIGRRPDGPLVNKTDGGEGVSGLKMSPESRAIMRTRALARSPEVWAKIIATKRANPLSPEVIARIAAAKRGKPLSPEHIAKSSAARRGKKRSPEAIAATAAANRGKTISPETRAKLAAANRGKTHSQETRAKMSATHQRKMLLPEYRAKMIGGMLGKKHSPETRARMSVSARNRKSVAQRELPW